MTTKGEYRVGINFNPSKIEIVDRIKRMTADAIDLIETIPDHDEGEIRRLKAQAQTVAEDAGMWAVKAATKQAWEPEDNDG
jgi:hypothetical protein